LLESALLRLLSNGLGLFLPKVLWRTLTTPTNAWAGAVAHPNYCPCVAFFHPDEPLALHPLCFRTTRVVSLLIRYGLIPVFAKENRVLLPVLFSRVHPCSALYGFKPRTPLPPNPSFPIPFSRRDAVRDAPPLQPSGPGFPFFQLMVEHPPDPRKVCGELAVVKVSCFSLLQVEHYSPGPGPPAVFFFLLHR